ncbi:MAG: efflux transporter periplasmic adaptor subunit [Gammaproteobacteria bacterium]|nr:efflux transporter periplasmic adaptor subunit [Gammaproteobacteria bacterium]HBW84431.1 efflux RND transporter periplasmic adaptor subunit [Gammaproteobacteria bacterium]
MKKQHLISLAIFGAIAVWMMAPRSVPSSAEVPEAAVREIQVVETSAQVSDNPNVISIRAERISPERYNEQIMVRGRTQAFRHVQVMAELPGRLVTDPIPRGARVRAGDVLCELAIDDRSANLNEALAQRERARFEYNASVDLQARDLQSDVVVAQLRAALESAEAAVTRAQLAVDRTQIVAPFDGVIETRTVEVGDLLNVGSVCASVLDDSPMLLVGLIPEQEVNRILIGAEVTGRLLGGKQVTGTVTFLAASADPVSRSYRVEIEIDSADEQIREGITTEILVKADEVLAHRIPSSALTLDDSGDIGIKVVEGDGKVAFYNVTIVGDDTNQLNPGIWVTGLRGDITLVTVGQEIVFPGQTVAANFDWDL